MHRVWAWVRRTTTGSAPFASRLRRAPWIALPLLWLVAMEAAALPVGFAASDYILIGTGPQGAIGTSTAISNYELGANTDAVPMSGLKGSVPDLPPNALPVETNIPRNGDVANTHPDGNFDLSNIDIWGDTGIDCAGPLSTCGWRRRGAAVQAADAAGLSRGR